VSRALIARLCKARRCRRPRASTPVPPGNRHTAAHNHRLFAGRFGCAKAVVNF
jgi:hypothetical protein